MKRRLPAILTLLVMALIGAMHWIDISYYTDTAGFVVRGEAWMRYLVLLLPLIMGLLGLRLVGPRAIAVMRLKNRGLSWLFIIAALANLVYGMAQFSTSLYAIIKGAKAPLPVYELLLGALLIWCGVWLFLASLQLAVQHTPSPTTSAVWGVLAALPYCMITIQRVLTKPTGLHRIAPMVRNFAALLVMLWFGMLLRSFYIALTSRRVRWMYLFGIFTFLFAACLEFPQAIHSAVFAQATAFEVMEAVTMGIMGLLAGCVSVAIARQGGAVVVDEVYYRQNS